MSSGTLLPTPVMQWFGAGGVPLAFGSVKTYLAGTTTFLPAYSDLALTVPYGPSIPLDAQGKAPIYLGPYTYKIDVQDQFGVSIDGYPRDNVPGQAFTGPAIDVKLFGAKGDGTTDDTVAIQTALNTLSTAGTVSAFGWALYFSPGRYRITASLIVTGSGYVRIFGDGVVSAILNQAPASNPTFNLSNRQYFLIEQLAILGNVNFPNDAISGPSCGFGRFNQLFLCPNGNGIHISDCNTIAIDNCQYWPSGYNAGATKTGALAQHAILGDGVTCNDIHIRWLNCVGHTTIANGGSAIKFAPSSNANNIAAYNCELEGVPPASAHAAFEFTKVSGFTLQDNFIENSTNTFKGCFYGRISQCEAGATASFVFGDGTLGNRCGQVELDAMALDTLNITANCYACGVQNSSMTTFTNAGVQTYFSNSSATNEGASAIDRGFPFGLRERERTTAMGAIITPVFNAGIFTADTGAWTLIAGNVLVWSYTLIGKTMTLWFGFDSTTVSGGPTNRLIATLPGGVTANMRTEVVMRAFNNSGATAVPGSATVFSGSTQIFFGPQQSSGGSWANAAAATSLFGQITFEIQ